MIRSCVWAAPLLVLTLAGCSSSTGADVAENPVARASESDESSVGAAVPQDDPTLARTDFGGNTPQDVVLAYVRATNRQDWKTRWALIAPPKEDYESLSAAWAQHPVPLDDFEIHETRLVEPGRALVRVTYSTIGFSSQEGLSPEDNRRLVVIREPGEWWVVEKGATDDARWGVTFKGPLD